MSELVPMLGCLAVLIVGVPVWAIVSALAAKRQADENRQRLDAVHNRLDQFETRLMELRRELREHPAAAAAAAEPLEPPSVALPIPPAAAPAPKPAPPPSSATPTAPTAPPLVQPSPPTPPTPPAATPPLGFPLVPAPPPPPGKSLDWESLISVRAFAWLGGGALFLGAALFLQYSIQHGLISPAARVAIGLVVGAVALWWGDKLRAKASWAGQATSGAGVAILYASLFAAHARYGLIGTPLTFAFMALVTVAAGVLAVRRNAFVLAVLGLLGGFLTPYLLSTNEDHPIGLLGYVLLLDLGVVAVARRRHWLEIRLLALLATAILYAAWASAHLDTPKLPWALAAAALLAGLFAAFRPELEADPRKKDLARAIPILASAAPLFLVIAVSSLPTLAVAPGFLVAYLLVLGGGALIVSRRTDFSPLIALTAGFSVVTLVARVGQDLFPARREEMLALFAVVPAAYLVAWIFRRDAEEGPALRAAAAIALAGALPILLRAVFLEKPAEPVLAFWVYAFGHAAGLLVIGGLLFSGAWIVGAQALIYLSLLALTNRYETTRLSEFLPLIAIPTLLFWALPFTGSRWRNDRASWLSSAAAPILYFPVLYVLAKPVWGVGVLGGLAILFAVAALASLQRAAAILEDAADRRFAMAIFGAITLLFVTAAIPILLDKEWISVAWALEAAALAWLATRIREDGLVKASAALAAAAFARLVLNPALWGYHPRSGTPILNWYLYTFGVPAVAFLLAARWSSPNTWARSVRMPEVLRVAAGVLLFVLLNVEIADFYSTGVSLTFRLSGGGLSEDMTYSLAWGVFAIGLLFLGLARRSKPTRAAALLVLLLTIGKVFLHDLWDLGALYRVGSIVGLAIALLAVSFLTQRFVLSKEQS